MSLNKDVIKRLIRHNVVAADSDVCGGPYLEGVEEAAAAILSQTDAEALRLAQLLAVVVLHAGGEVRVPLEEIEELDLTHLILEEWVDKKEDMLMVKAWRKG